MVTAANARSASPSFTSLTAGAPRHRYMAIASYAFFTLTGTIGFFACWFFVRAIYGAVKVE